MAALRRRRKLVRPLSPGLAEDGRSTLLAGTAIDLSPVGCSALGHGRDSADAESKWLRQLSG
jgi:hypothetical protein